MCKCGQFFIVSHDADTPSQPVSMPSPDTRLQFGIVDSMVRVIRTDCHNDRVTQDDADR